MARQGGRSAKIPTVTYLIDNMLMFQFQGTPMLLVAFENQQVNVFESSNGHYVDEFHFQDNVFDTGHPNEDGEMHEAEGK